MNKKRFYVAQLGAREHYAVAAALYRHDRLAGLYTDFWATPSQAALLKNIPLGILRRMGGRRNPLIPELLVTSTNFLTLASTIGDRLMSRGTSDIDRFFYRQGTRFGKQTVAFLQRTRPDFASTVFYGYTGTSLEPLEYIRNNGGTGILNQIAIWKDWEIAEAERQCWPEWEECSFVPCPESLARVQQEWRTAALIVVNSPAAQRSLVEAGISADKIIIVPLTYDKPCMNVVREKEIHRPLRILFLGQVRLQKGIQYLISAARQLGKIVEIKVAGEILINPEKLKDAPDNMIFLGICPRHLTSDLYRWADVFIFPTLADGFGMTQLEAAAHSLPIIATPCCGEVVRDGVEGLIIPPRAPEAIVDSIMKLYHNPELRLAMGKNALLRVGTFSVDRVAEKIIDAVDNLEEA